VGVGDRHLARELENHCQPFSSAFATEINSQGMLIQQQLMSNWVSSDLEQAGEGTLKDHGLIS